MPISVSWDIPKELLSYVTKFSSVSSVCRLTVAQETRLIQMVSMKDLALMNRRLLLDAVSSGLEHAKVMYHT